MLPNHIIQEAEWSPKMTVPNMYVRRQTLMASDSYWLCSSAERPSQFGVYSLTEEYIYPSTRPPLPRITPAPRSTFKQTYKQSTPNPTHITLQSCLLPQSPSRTNT